MKVRFRGVRGSLPTPGAAYARYGGNTPCLEVLQDDPHYAVVLDCGTGARELGKELASRGGPLEIHLLLTHFHWDHIQGLPFFAPLFTPGARLIIHSTAPADETRRRLALQMAGPYFPFPLDKAAATIEYRSLRHGERFRVAGMDAWAFPLHHPQGSDGFRIETQGSSLVYATDHEHGKADTDAALLEASSEAGLLVLDAQYTVAEYASHVGWGHSSTEHAAATAERANVRRLVFFHHDPSHDDDFLDGMLAEARDSFTASTMAAEGVLLDATHSPA